jgi:CHAT domain-containing protein/Flp pilus assembly protein TadD
MGLKRFFWIAPTTVLLIVLQTFRLNFPVMFAASPVVAQTSDVRKVEADRLLQQGFQQFDASQFEAALQSLQQAINIYQEIKDRRSEGLALAAQGIAYRHLGNLSKAIEYAQKSLVIAREIKDRQSEGLGLNSLGIAYISLEDYAKAIEYYQQWLAIAREIKDRKGEGSALTNLGVAYLNLGDYSKVIDYQQQYLTIAREIKDREDEANTLRIIGTAYLYQGNYYNSINYQQQSLVITREIKDRKGEGQSLGNIGIAYLNLGDYPKAIEYSQQWLVIAREIKNRIDEGRVLGNLGATYSQLGDYPQAIEYSQQSLAIAKEIKSLQIEGTSLGNLGATYLELGDCLKAIEYFKQHLAIAQEIKDRKSQVMSLANLSSAYSKLGDYPKAIDYSQQSLVIAREIKDRQSEGKLLGNIAITYLYLEDYPKTIDYSQQSLVIAREIKDHRSERDVLNNIGLTFYKQGKFTLAENTLIEAMNVSESLRGRLKDKEKVSIFDTQSNTYRTLQQVLIAQNKTNAALEIAERGRARAFVELLEKRLSVTDSVADVVDKSTVGSLSKPSIAQIKQIAKQQNATLVQYSIIYDDYKVQGKQRIKESELYIWVIKPTGEVTFRKADIKPLWQQQNTSLKDLVITTRNSIGVDDRSIFIAEVQHPVNEEEQTKNLQQLYQLLIAPIADLLPADSNQRVIFVPQNELFLVPFAALQDTQGKYLIEKHTILTAPSIQVLELTHQQREKVKQAAVKDALVLGNPTMPSVPPKIGEKPQQLASLPGAKREAEDIASVLNTKALTGNEATKPAVLTRLPGARIVHLATHGLFDDFQGLQSAVALAPTSSDNGLLTAEEILNLKLNADLVVLSACNTGRGRITGDGVIGLSRSLFIAGTPSVLVSLWAVPDAPTAELMSEFYTNLYQNKLDKAQALRQTMLTMMEKHRNNPRAWAAFTLIGEAE